MKFSWMFVSAFILLATAARAECIGEEDYRVCTDSYTDADGTFHIRSYDTDGNSYAVESGSRDLPGGAKEIYSEDSEGNTYSVRSWSDSTGVHSLDSEGNRCTITTSGTMIGCGQ